MSTVIRVMGAYGRMYANGIGIAEDWLSGKDFKILGGAYFSIRDVAALYEAGFRELHVVHRSDKHETGWATKIIHLKEKSA